MSSMMSHLLCRILLLVFLTGTAIVQGKPTNYALECGEDKSCEKFAQLMSGVNVIRNQLNELATCTTVNEKLDKLATNVHAMHEKQAKDLEELKTDLKRTLLSMAAINTKIKRHSTDLLSHDERLKAHDVLQRNEYQLVQSIYEAELGPRDCSDIRERGYNVSGVYRVYPGCDDKRIKMDVYCDFQSLGEGWLVFQRRKDGSVNFERLWKDYANGFGNLTDEFWIGNDRLSLLTMNRNYKLRIELEDFTGEKRYAEYSIFSVKPATDKYLLTVGGYSGNAGDGLAYHNGLQFTTKDIDNDRCIGNCAVTYRGAWWYNQGHNSNLNGRYLGGSHTSFADGIGWYHWRGHHYSFKTTEMKIAAI